MQFERDESMGYQRVGSSTKTVVLKSKIIIILFCVCSIRKFNKFSADLNIIQPGLHF